MYQMNLDPKQCFVCNDQVAAVGFLGAGMFLQTMMTYGAKVSFASIAFAVSKYLFASSFEAVSRSPYMWFNINPVGRVMNVFTKDCQELDQNLYMTLDMVLSQAHDDASPHAQRTIRIIDCRSIFVVDIDTLKKTLF
jgi:hypothetical protein